MENIRDKINNLRQQLHTAVDMFYDETGMLPVIEVVTQEVTHNDKTMLGSSIEIVLK